MQQSTELGLTWIRECSLGSWPNTIIWPLYIQLAAISPAWSTRNALSKVSRWTCVKSNGDVLNESSLLLVGSRYALEGLVRMLLEIVLEHFLAALRYRWRSTFIGYTAYKSYLQRHGPVIPRKSWWIASGSGLTTNNHLSSISPS